MQEKLENAWIKPYDQEFVVYGLSERCTQIQMGLLKLFRPIMPYIGTSWIEYNGQGPVLHRQYILSSTKWDGFMLCWQEISMNGE